MPYKNARDFAEIRGECNVFVRESHSSLGGSENRPQASPYDLKGASGECDGRLRG